MLGKTGHFTIVCVRDRAGEGPWLWVVPATGPRGLAQAHKLEQGLREPFLAVTAEIGYEAAVELLREGERAREECVTVVEDLGLTQ